MSDEPTTATNESTSRPRGGGTADDGPRTRAPNPKPPRGRGPHTPETDLIVVLSEDGTVAERGTHDELLAKGGRYAESWTTTTTASEKRG
ncbi:hypothetical protein [Corynebacterium amycolatum]